MNLLVDGEWRTGVDEYTDDEGEFRRSTTTFRRYVEGVPPALRGWGDPDAPAPFPVEAGRYHVYISRACPWAHRVALARRLTGLTDAVSLSLVRPERYDEGWEFSAAHPDPLYGADYLREIYTRADPGYTGRVTVPVLWDRERETVVNNESAEIVRMLDVGFHDLGNGVDLYPEGYRDEVDRTIEAVYDPINNGVYRAGFAGSQAAYDAAVDDLFDALDRWESVLDGRRYLADDRLTEADLALFATLVRFDHVYHTIPTTFANDHRGVDDPRPEKWKRLRDYDNLYAYTRDIYQTDGVAETVNMDHIVRHYASPGSPELLTHDVDDVDLNLDAPHDRARIGNATADASGE
jgi:putative glutathione S-transferase